MFGAVYMGTEPCSFLFQLAVCAQRKHLKASAVGEYGSFPPHEPVQTACLAQQFGAGAQIEMICVSENYLCVNIIGQFVTMNSLHRPDSANGHENRCLYSAVGGGNLSCAGCRALRGG